MLLASPLLHAADPGQSLPPRTEWPSRTRPQAVTVDGRQVDGFDAGGIALAAPFRTLEARW